MELTEVYYDSYIHCYTTRKLFIRPNSIVSVTETDERFGGYYCTCVRSNDKIYYVTESYKYIVDKMNNVINIIYKEGEDNDWK